MGRRCIRTRRSRDGVLLMRWRLSGRDWKLAGGLQTLAHQVDVAYPTRHSADGTLGNLAHSSRDSDHNPDDNGIVRAIDIGEVVEGDGFAVAEALRQSKDVRIKYVIHEERMYSYYWKNGYRPFTWRPYNGTNPHSNHVHISSRRSYDSLLKQWSIERGGDDLAYLTRHEQEELSKFLKNLDTLGSNVSFVNFLIPWYRKWRMFVPSNFLKTTDGLLKRGDSVKLD